MDGFAPLAMTQSSCRSTRLHSRSPTPVIAILVPPNGHCEPQAKQSTRRPRPPPTPRRHCKPPHPVIASRHTVVIASRHTVVIASRPTPSLRAEGEAIHGPHGSRRSARDDGQIDHFADFKGLQSTAAATELYAHDRHWSNRTLFEGVLLDEEGHTAWPGLQRGLLERMGEPTCTARHMTAPGEA